jgi:photosystem II stability/assembly factor-like uncharacterized protein
LRAGFALPALYSLDMRQNTMEGFAVGASGTLIRTCDGGRTWERLVTGVAADLFSIRFFADGTRGLISGDGMTLLYTVDAGQTWARATLV